MTIASQNLTVCEINDLDNGITEIRFHQKYVVDVAEMREIQTAISKVSELHPVYLLVIPGPEGSVTNEARAIPFTNMKGPNSVKAVAIITKLLHQRILGKIFFQYKKEKFKSYQMFKTEKNAVAWLKQKKEL